MKLKQLWDLCSDEQEHSLGEGFTVRRHSGDININLDNSFVAWFSKGDTYLSFRILSEVEEDEEKAQKIKKFFAQAIADAKEGPASLQRELTEETSSCDNCKELQNELDDAHQQNAHLKGVVATYERLITGGYTHLSK